MQDRDPLRLITHGVPQIGDPHPNILQFLQTSKLLPLKDIGFPTIIGGLVNAFIERWHSDTSSFHLPIGEMTITLDDVSALLHIPVTGNFYDFPEYTKYQGEALLIHLLGADPQDAHDQTKGPGLSVTLKWLRETVYPRAIQEERWEDAARAYLLYLLGWGPFSDKSGNKVKLGWLGALVDFEVAGDYTWGGMALAHIYDQLGESVKPKNKQMGGYLALIQVSIKFNLLS